MFSIFNIIRASIYCTYVSSFDHHGYQLSIIALVFLWSIICLAIAAHFQSVLSASDLSEFSFHEFGDACLIPRGSSFCTIRNICIFGNTRYHSRAVRVHLTQHASSLNIETPCLDPPLA